MTRHLSFTPDSYKYITTTRPTSHACVALYNPHTHKYIATRFHKTHHMQSTDFVRARARARAPARADIDSGAT